MNQHALSLFSKWKYFLCFIIIILLFPSTQTPVSGQESANADTCLECHSIPDISMQFPSGEIVSAYVDREKFTESVHGAGGLTCSSCHKDRTEFPHSPFTNPDHRDYSVDIYPVCTECHVEQLEEIRGNVHMVALAEGNPLAAVCTDCHGNHYVQSNEGASLELNRNCGKCHVGINERFEKSVHGSALAGEGNPDVPLCTDCHGSHEMIGPSNYPFHLHSLQICGNCHSDRKLMEKYDINPNVFDTYVSDFHGKAVVIFESVASDQETNQPVCIDCHGIHDIRAPDDANSTVLKENLIVTCRKCHPDASASFPDSWMSHYSPGPNQFKPLFIIQIIYWITIPLIVAAAAVYVTSDYIRMRNKIRRGNQNV